MVHKVTSEDFTLKGDNNDTYYIGPLEPAQAFIKTDHDVAELFEDGIHTVLLGFSLRDGEELNWGTADDWGRAPSLEEAWRFVLGAAFGPLDDEFSEIELVCGSFTTVGPNQFYCGLEAGHEGDHGDWKQ